MYPKMKNTILIFFLLIGFASFSQTFNLQSGINYYKEQKYDEALSFLKKEIIQNPKEGKAYYYHALINVEKETYGQGLSHINLAISNLNPSDSLIAFAWQLKGDIYFHLEDLGNFESCYTKAIELNPKNTNIYYRRAIAYVGFKQYEKAISDINRVFELEEGNIPARDLLATIYHSQEKYEEVIKACDLLIKLDPSNASAYDKRSNAFFKLGKFDLAILDSYAALTFEDKSSQIRDNFITFSKKNFTLSLAKISALIKEYPQKDLWLYVRSQVYRYKRDYKMALNDFSKIFEIIPEAYKSYYYGERAALYGEIGMHNLAINDYNESIKLDSSAYDFGNRGDEYRLLGNFSSAITDFDKAIEMNPEEAWFYYRRGWVKDDFLKDHEGGLADYSSAIELDRNYAYPYLHRGRIFANRYKDTIRANADFRKVIELDTIIDNSGNCRQYGFYELGQFDKAKAWMNKILIQFPEEGNYYDAACLYSLMKLPSKSLAYLDTAFVKGYRDFEHLAKDDDFDNVRNSHEFKLLVSKWKAKFSMTSIRDSQGSSNEKATNKVVGTYIIPFKPNGGGTYEVKSKINGLPLNMLFDTGASDILISQTEVDFMLKNGYLTEQDFIGSNNYYTANEDMIEARTVMLRQVEIGGLVIKNVLAAVIKNRKAGMLFGQSALSRYGKITIDNLKKQIVLTGNMK
jgi:clan AA aspartic protease (TIGR02281 family)